MKQEELPSTLTIIGAFLISIKIPNLNFQQLKKLYQGFQPVLINTPLKTKNTVVLTNQPGTQLNPQDFIQQHLIPVSQLPSQLPIDYIPELPENLSFVCVFCEKFLSKPKMHHCGCLTCESCEIDQTSICPIHLVSFGTKTELNDEYSAYYRQFQLQCPFSIEGCAEITNVLDLQSHIQVCKFSIVKCPYCEKVGPRSTFDKHYTVCQILPSQCKICQEDIDKALIIQHVEECHPACNFCGERKKQAEDPDHESVQCVVPGCAEVTAVCALKRHLTDIVFASVHCDELVQRCYYVETLNLEYLQKIQEQDRIVDELRAQQTNVIELKLQLREATIQKQRIEMLSSGQQPTLVDISAVLNCQERVRVVYQLFKTLENLKIQNDIHEFQPDAVVNGLFVPECVKFDVHLQLQIVYLNLNDFKEFNSCYQDEVLVLIKEQQQLLLQYLCVTKAIRQYLISAEGLSKSEVAVNQILLDFTTFIDQLLNSRVQKLAPLLQYLFFILDTMFGELMQLPDDVSLIDDVVDFRLLQYYANQITVADEENEILTGAKPLKLNLQFIQEFAAFFKMPIAKYSASSGQIFSVVQLEPQVVQNYDFVLQNSCSIPPFVLKCFVRSIPPATHFAGRLLIYKPMPQVEKLLSLIPANLQQFAIQNGNSLQSNVLVEQLLKKVSGYIQDLFITAGSFDSQAELTEAGLIQQIGECSNLIKLEMVNQRIAGHAAEALHNWDNLQMLRELYLLDVELCYPSQLSLNFENLTTLFLVLRCNEARRKLYEADVLQLCHQIRNLQNLEILVISFSNEFSIPPKAAWALADGCAQLPKLQTLRVLKVNLRSDTFNVFIQKLAAVPYLQELDLSQNPIFNVENIEQSCNILGDFLLTSQNLQILNFSDTRLTSRVLSLIVTRLFATAENLVSLSEFNLSKNKLTDEDVKSFSKLLMKTPVLQKVNFQYCRDITPRGLRSILGRVGSGFQIVYEAEQQQAMLTAGFVFNDGVYYVQ